MAVEMTCDTCGKKIPASDLSWTGETIVSVVVKNKIGGDDFWINFKFGGYEVTKHICKECVIEALHNINK